MPLSVQDLKDIIINDAARVGNDPALMLSLADHESAGFNPNALSPTGVRGLFQVTNATGNAYGQTPQTRTDPRVSSDAGQRHFKDLLFKAGGDVPTALTWYNGGSDKQFAQKVLAKYAAHQASLTQEPSVEALHKAVYGDTPLGTPAATPEAEPSVEDLHKAVYGPPQPTAPTAPAPSATPGVSVPQAPAAPTKPDGRDIPLPAAAAALDMSGFAIPVMTPRESQDVARQYNAQAVQTGGVVAGTAAGTVVGMPVTGAIAGGLAANRVNRAVGLTPQESPVTNPITGTPLSVPVLGDITSSDVLATAAPVVTALGSSVAQGVLRQSAAGQAIKAANDKTKEALDAWQQAAADAEAVRGGNAQAYQDALLKARIAQGQYRDQLREWHATVQANQDTYDAAMQAQQNAITNARAAPGTISRDTPSWTLYEKAAAAGKDIPVDMQPIQQRFGEILTELPKYADGSPLPLPAALQRVVKTVQNAGNTVDAQTIQEQLRLLGPFTRARNGDIRAAAKQMYAAFADGFEATANTLPETATVRNLWLQAKSNWRQEMALEDVAEWLRPGNGIVRIDGRTGQEQINVGTLLTQFEHEMSDPHSLFRGSFTPEEAQSLRESLYRLRGTPAMPTAEPTIPARPPVPGNINVAQKTVPDVGPQPSAVDPRTLLTPPNFHLWPTLTAIGGTLGIGHEAGFPLAGRIVAGMEAAYPVVKGGNYLLSKGLLTPSLRPLVEQAVERGTIDPRLYGVLSSVLESSAGGQTGGPR